MTRKALSLLFLACCCLLIGGAGALSLQEQQALLDLAAAYPFLQTLSSGTRWNVSDVANACARSWTALGCTSGNVTSVSFSRYLSPTFVGPISPAFGNLSMMNYLYFSDMPFNGTFPVELLQLTRLTRITLTNTLLSGPLPDFSLLPQLQSLDVYGSPFNGTLPDNWGAYSSLVSLNIDGTAAVGTIPESLGQARNLTTLRVGYKLNGTIPASLGLLPKLQSVSFSGSITGTIPPELSQQSLRSVAISNTKLTGELPASWASVPFTTISVYGNSLLNGTLPAVWGNISSLTGIAVPGNSLTGSIPESWGNLGLLGDLRLENNRLTGPLPASFARLTNLSRALIYGNSLGGPLPDANVFRQFKKLTTFYFYDNRFTSLGGVFSVPDLVQLSGRDNLFGGPIQLFSGTPQKLQYLDLTNNRLNGTIPNAIASIPTLRTLYLGGNSLSGTIPASFAASTTLAELILINNSLTGDIPAFRRDRSMVNLDFSGNSLSYCWVEPDSIGSCSVERNPNACVCNRRDCLGPVCANCTITNTDGKNNTCVLPPRPNGFPSPRDDRCESGIASNGHCCSSRCSKCESCETGSCVRLSDGPSPYCNISCSLLAAGWSNLTCSSFRDDLVGICTAGVCSADTSRCLSESDIAPPTNGKSCGSYSCQRSTVATCVPLTPLSSYPTLSSICYVSEPGNCAINNCDELSRCLPPPPPVAAFGPAPSLVSSVDSRASNSSQIILFALAGFLSLIL